MDGDFRAACTEMMTACACEGIRQAARSVTSRYQHALAASGVRAAQLPILVGAALMGPAPITALADVLVLDRTTLTRNLAGLERDGLVRIEEDDDRRVRLVSLTDEGRSTIEGAITAWRGAQAGVREAFGPERLHALLTELRAFREAIA
jgi:DNA-binding MarR family transcriptional regulator